MERKLNLNEGILPFYIAPDILKQLEKGIKSIKEAVKKIGAYTVSSTSENNDTHNNAVLENTTQRQNDVQKEKHIGNNGHESDTVNNGHESDGVRGVKNSISDVFEKPITKTEEVVETPSNRTDWVMSLIPSNDMVSTSFLLENLSSMKEEEVMAILKYQAKVGGIFEKKPDFWVKLE